MAQSRRCISIWLYIHAQQTTKTYKVDDRNKKPKKKKKKNKTKKMKTKLKTYFPYGIESQ